MLSKAVRATTRRCATDSQCGVARVWISDSVQISAWADYSVVGSSQRVAKIVLSMIVVKSGLGIICEVKAVFGG